MLWSKTLQTCSTRAATGVQISDFGLSSRLFREELACARSRSRRQRAVQIESPPTAFNQNYLVPLLCNFLFSLFTTTVLLLYRWVLLKSQLHARLLLYLPKNTTTISSILPAIPTSFNYYHYHHYHHCGCVTLIQPPTTTHCPRISRNLPATNLGFDHLPLVAEHCHLNR